MLTSGKVGVIGALAQEGRPRRGLLCRLALSPRSDPASRNSASAGCESYRCYRGLGAAGMFRVVMAAGGEARCHLAFMFCKPACTFVMNVETMNADSRSEISGVTARP
jgi:hypothetical protein